MKRYITYIFALTMAAAAGCSEQEMPDYSDMNDRINFIAVKNLVVYPDDLSATVNFNDLEYAGLDEVPVTITVQVQGYSAGYDTDRTVVFTSENETGTGGGVVPDEYTVPAGENTATFDVLFSREGLLLGKETVLAVTFDYAKSDFLPGIDIRQTFRLTCQNLYTLASVGIASQATWDNGYNGFLFLGMVWDDGYGPFSSQKALFIAETLGISNFQTELPNIYHPNIATTLATLRAALADYKALHAADPDTYPALIDEVKGGNNWIAFEPE